MGYTQYFSQQAEIAEGTWELIATDARRIIGAARGQGIEIRGWDGTGDPVVDENEIRLNGDASAGLDHETFALLRKGSGFGFCKTARQPYDVVVTSILVRAQQHAGEETIRLSSDGGETDWFDALLLLRILFPNDPHEQTIARATGGASVLD
jgi:hypothetical protein